MKEIGALMKYCEAIKLLRMKMILTQEEFANLLGVSFAAVNRWETDKHTPTTKTKRKLAPLFEKYNIVVEYYE